MAHSSAALSALWVTQLGSVSRCDQALADVFAVQDREYDLATGNVRDMARRHIVLR